MPFVRIDHSAGKTDEYRQALSRGVHAALTATFSVPEDDRFQVITGNPPGALIHPASYMGNTYSGDVVLIQLTVSDTRSLEQKRALYAAIVENLARDPGLRPEDVVISLVEVKTEDWSFGKGIASYVP